MKRSLFIILSVLVALSMLLAACQPAAAPTEAEKPTEAAAATQPAEKPAAPAQTIRVATEAAYPPFEMVRESDKQLEGFDIDLMNAIAEKAGFKVEYANTPFDSVIAGISTCQFDAAISAITITEERKQKIAFSDPYINAGQITTVRVDNNEIKGPADLKGKTIGVQLSTTGQIEAEKIEGATVKPYDTVDLAFLDLANGQVDAVVADYPTTLNYVNKMSDKIKTTGDVFTEESYGVAICKQNTELLDKVNKAMAELKSEGKLKELETKWLAASSSGAEAAPAGEAQTIRVATEAAYPPFEMVRESDKELEGFDIDLMNAIAEKANLKVEYANTPFDSVIAGISTCQFDAAISAITITEERKQKIGFSEPYINAGQVTTVRVDNTDIKGPADLKGKTIGVQLSTTGQIEAEKIEGATVKPYDTVDLAFLDLANGQVDAVVADYPTTLNYVNRMKDKIKTTGDIFTEESYGIAVCKQNTELLDKINKALAELKSEGKLKEFETKWLAAQ